MSKEIVFTFKIGNFECIAVNDGTVTYAPPIFPPPATFLFPSAPKDRLEQVLHQYHIQLKEWTGWVSPYICLVITTDEHKILVDTGAGSLRPTTGKLLQNLQIGGVSPNDIDTVILTHGHADHIGGNLTNEGKFAFPNAKFVMCKGEWDLWTSEPDKLTIKDERRKFSFDFAHRYLLPIKGNLKLIDTETDIVPGIRAIATPGHTPGHISLTVSSNSEQLLVVSDAFLHPIHIEYPDWFAAIDAIPQLVVNTRRRLLNLMTEKTTVLVFHFPFPGLGHISQKGETWQWRPLENGD